MVLYPNTWYLKTFGVARPSWNVEQFFLGVIFHLKVLTPSSQYDEISTLSKKIMLYIVRSAILCWLIITLETRSENQYFGWFLRFSQKWLIQPYRSIYEIADARDFLHGSFLKEYRNIQFPFSVTYEIYPLFNHNDPNFTFLTFT